MILCIKCSRETKSKLDGILQTTEYADYGEVITSAISNLHLLLAEMGQKGTLVLGGGEAHAPDSSRQYTEGAGPRPRGASGSGIPELFCLPDRRPQPETVLALQPERATPEGGVPLHKWVFGQFNRLLTAKASARGLANLLDKYPDGFDIDAVAPLIAEQAVALGTYLEFHDRRNGLSRDEALSVAFPRGGERTEKSAARYAHHFVGSLSKQLTLSGILGAMRLIALRDADSRLCQLTESGWCFATMENAVLEGVQEWPGQRFTEAELEFFLDHIRRHVPEEVSAFNAVAEAIRAGADTPSGMDALLSESVPPEVKAKVSKAYLSAQRSGVVSRMAGLGLLTRIRDGTRVRYVMTERGTAYVATQPGIVGPEI